VVVVVLATSDYVHVCASSPTLWLASVVRNFRRALVVLKGSRTGEVELAACGQHAQEHK
jgi:hypothetical protein